jgi:hypothetical protein
MIDGVETLLRSLPDQGLDLTYLPLPALDPGAVPRDGHHRINEARNFVIARVAAQVYVFTEDDCTFEADWLRKLDSALLEGVGAAGGPDLLPPGMGWFAITLDCIINSVLGRVGAKPKQDSAKGWYHPHKENMAITANAFDRVGTFPPQRLYGAELEMARRIRAAGMKTVYLADNPVWHKRITTFPTLIRSNVQMAMEKVHVMRENGTFLKSFHFIALLAALLLLLVVLGATVSATSRWLLILLMTGYVAGLGYMAVGAAKSSGKKSVGWGVLLITPLHQLSIVIGIVAGALTAPQRTRKGADETSR